MYRKIAAQTPAPVLYCETPLLRERKFGALEGKPYHTLGCDSVATVGDHLYHLEIADGESKASTRKRAGDALQFLVQYQDPGMRTVVVGMTHGCFMNYLLSALKWNDHEEGLLPYRSSGNLSGFRVSITKLGVHELFPFPSHKSAYSQ